MYTKLENFKYKIVDNEIHIKRCDKNSGSINIAPTYKIDGKDYKVTRLLNEKIFMDKITSVKIPETIEHIGANVFYSAYSLEKIEVDKKNKKYLSENGALFNKTKTTLIKVPRFSEIKELNLSGTTTIKDCACAGCKNLEKVVFDKKTETTGAFTFEYCEKLKDIILPEKLTTIGRHCFFSCQKLENIIFPEKLNTIAASAFQFCVNLKEIKLPDSVSAIGMNAFSDCYSLNKINIPKNVDYIRNGTFDCININTLILDHAIKISLSAFSNSKLRTLYIGEFPKSLEPEDILPIFSTLENIYILNSHNFNWNSNIVDFMKKCGVIFHTEKSVEELETQGYDYSQISQIINGYNKGIILTNIPIDTPTSTFRELIQCWSIDKFETLNILNLFSNEKLIDNKIKAYEKIKNILNQDKEKYTERKER